MTPAIDLIDLSRKQAILRGMHYAGNAAHKAKNVERHWPEMPPIIKMQLYTKWSRVPPARWEPRA